MRYHVRDRLGGLPKKRSVNTGQHIHVSREQRFREAIAYARAAMTNPKVRAHYEKVGKKAKRQPFRVAVSDFYAGKDLLEK
jgi:hypothetical protein